MLSGYDLWKDSEDSDYKSKEDYVKSKWKMNVNLIKLSNLKIYRNTH